MPWRLGAHRDKLCLLVENKLYGKFSSEMMYGLENDSVRHSRRECRASIIFVHIRFMNTYTSSGEAVIVSNIFSYPKKSCM